MRSVIWQIETYNCIKICYKHLVIQKNMQTKQKQY